MFPKIFPFFLKMGELFAHFDKMDFFWETYKIFRKFSNDFPQCALSTYTYKHCIHLLAFSASIHPIYLTGQTLFGNNAKK